jgi:L-malate glycosyltransferase
MKNSLPREEPAVHSDLPSAPLPAPKSQVDIRRMRTWIQPLQVGLIFDLTPRKLGSIEDWIVALAHEARGRNHGVDVFCRRPVHPVIAERLQKLGVGVLPVEGLLRNPARAAWKWSRYDVLQLNFVAPICRAALAAYGAVRPKVVLVDHISGEAAERSGLRGRIERPLRRLLTRRIAKVVGVSEFVRSRDARHYELTDSRAVTIHNGVDLSRFAVTPRLDRSGPVRIRAVAYLIPEKGIDTLIRAFARMSHNERRLDIIGDGPELGNLRHLADDLTLGNRVVFLGLRDDVHELLKTTEIFVHPARWAEAFGLTIAEAMAAGVPVVATRTGGIPEILEDGKTGLLFDPDDVSGLAKRLDQLAALPHLRASLGAEGRRWVEKCFDLLRSAQEHVRVLEEVIGEPAPNAAEPFAR